MVKLTRISENPILTPSPLPWENALVFNAAAAKDNGTIYLLYRAMGDKDEMSRLGLATSTDGIHFNRLSSPVYAGGGHDCETLGIEDPRMVKIDDTFYITYTAVSPNSDIGVDVQWRTHMTKRPQIALSTTQDFTSYTDYDVIMPGIDGKNASFFPKKMHDQFWLLYREGRDITYLTHGDDVKALPKGEPVFDKRPGMWDGDHVGIGAQPIETEKGWLLFYHGVDTSNIYRLGVMFLDLKNPAKILYRSAEPIFEPETSYEKMGFVPNIVFTCGAVEMGDEYYVYYGAADQVIGLATVKKADILSLF